jgi:hypothetical protein
MTAGTMDRVKVLHHGASDERVNAGEISEQSAMNTDNPKGRSVSALGQGPARPVSPVIHRVVFAPRFGGDHSGAGLLILECGHSTEWASSEITPTFVVCSSCSLADAPAAKSISPTREATSDRTSTGSPHY